MIKAVRLLDELEADRDAFKACADLAEKAAIKTLERLRDRCGWCHDYHKGGCKHNFDWDACNKYDFEVTVERLAADEKQLDELFIDREKWKARAEALENCIKTYTIIMCVSCKHFEQKQLWELFCKDCPQKANFPHYELDQAHFVEPERTVVDEMLLGFSKDREFELAKMERFLNGGNIDEY